MAKTTKVAVFSKAQSEQLCRFITARFGSHQICTEQALYDLAGECGMCYVPRTLPEARNVKRRYEGVLFAPNGIRLCGVNLLHRDKYAKMVEDEGLGGSVKEGNWWGFSALALVECIAMRLNPYNGYKMGRGGRYWEAVEALQKWASSAK